MARKARKVAPISKKVCISMFCELNWNKNFLFLWFMRNIC